MLMSNSQSNLFFLIFITLLVSSLASDDPTELIKSCLSKNQVSNFTVFAKSDNNSYYSYYYHQLLYFSIQNLRFTDSGIPKPIAIVLPESKDQLVSTFLCCRQHSLEFKIRCGGHSYEGLSYVSDDGAPFVIIDMMNLNRVSVDLASETAWVEGGATLGETYYAISEASESHGFSAGSCPTVGSGGHIAGGGYGLLSRKYGLAADNVIDAILIDAQGRVLDREAMGRDVFWAIRGGGGGVWGIVYAWKIRLLKVPKVVTVFSVSRPATKFDVAELVHQWQFVGPYLDDKFYASAFVGAGLPEAVTPPGIISAIFKGLYLGPKTKAISILNQAFPQLGIVEEDSKEMSWIKSVMYFSELENVSSTSNLRDRLLHGKGYFKAKSDYVKTPISKEGIRSALKVLEKEPKGHIILDPYGGKMARISSGSIAFPHRKGNLFTIQYLVSWKKEENWKSEQFISWIRSFYKAMTPYVSKSPRSAYVNYVDLDLGVMDMLKTNSSSDDDVNEARVWGEKYFLRNYERLVQAKTQIDPQNLFKNPQGIPPMKPGLNLIEKM
ncbi:hypothetical protein Scep_025158 [Stephania cephalantha]|uniref:FAD-binding PCMH-type domain-containing protein n=1 Tax=Stephania cephalantha TaxID=152367 RepID=A0AAP0HP02_9MAGN